MELAILTAVLGAALAAAATYVVMRTQAGRQLAEARAVWAGELAAAKQDNKWLQQDAERERQTTAATKEVLDKAERQLREAFQGLAAEALRANQGAFLDLAKATFEGLKNETTAQMDARHKAIDTLVRPLSDSLKAVEVRLGDTERTRIDSYARLTEQLASLGAATQTLARALRTPSVRGRWGEMQLRRVVELSGMLQHCDFEEQPALWSDAGRLRPDLIVHLPGGKQMVVDAKVPLEAFLEAHETTDEQDRTARLQAHARHVREHMDKLGAKG
jgi:DNA recombination protein RmuC